MDFERAVSEWDAFSNTQATVSSENAARREPIHDGLDSEDAQRIIDRVQLELDYELENTQRNRRLGFLRYLSKKFQLLPLSLVLLDVERDGSNPVAGGGFADIWRGSLKERPVCLKVLRFAVEQDERARARMRKQFCHEALVWRQLKHPNILPLLGVNTDLFFPSFCLVSPWMEHRDIITYLKKNPVHDLPSVLLDVAAGTDYLHSREPPVIHGDIRGGNILVTDDHRFCLADFGLTLVSTQSQTWSMTTSSATTKGSMRWLAPEYVNPTVSSPNHTSRDVYAFGCTIVEIITQKPPFHELKNDAQVLLNLMISEARPTRPENVWCSDEIWDLATCCWAQNMQDRPSANEIYRILTNLTGGGSGFIYPPPPTRLMQDTMASAMRSPDGSNNPYGDLVSTAGSVKNFSHHANVTHSKSRPQRDFLVNLYALLNNPENEDMIRWDLQGAHIIIEKPAKFAWHVLPSVFQYSKFTTFSRQLSIYGFTRIVDLRNINPAIVDPDASIWSHPTLNRNSSPQYLASFRRRVSMELPKHQGYPVVTKLEVEESPSPFRFSPPGLEPDQTDVGGHLPPRYERTRSRPSSSSSQSSVD